MTFDQAIAALEDPATPRADVLPAIVAALRALRPKAGKAHQLPDDWQPTDAHAERAHREGLDIEREAEKFRLHAEATGRTMKSWPAAFTTWLLNARDFAPNKPPADSEAGQWDAEAEQWRDKRLQVRAHEQSEMRRLTTMYGETT